MLNRTQVIIRVVPSAAFVVVCLWPWFPVAWQSAESADNKAYTLVGNELIQEIIHLKMSRRDIFHSEKIFS